MPDIKLLDEATIEKIAAGEVVERPSSVVKELVENAIDARATFITVEIKEGGMAFLRVTDNGCGIEKEQVKLAFLRHSTSKIRSMEDLLSVKSLGFRGEALASISAVSQVELITRPRGALTGARYVIEGSKEKLFEEVGAPEGTTFIMRNLFFNTPVRRKFLKTAQTEGSYVAAVIEHLALSHPEISFQLIVNNQPKLHTSGNCSRRDIIYHIYGKDIAANLLSVDSEKGGIHLSGLIGKPVISRGNRNYENYFVNGRYMKSQLIAKALEEAYKPYLMNRQYPFTALYITMDEKRLDVNVHPTKMEARFAQGEQVYECILQLVREVLSRKDLVAEVIPGAQAAKRAPQSSGSKELPPQPFERRRLSDMKERAARAKLPESSYEKKYAPRPIGPRDEGSRTQPNPTAAQPAGMQQTAPHSPVRSSAPEDKARQTARPEVPTDEEVQQSVRLTAPEDKAARQTVRPEVPTDEEAQRSVRLTASQEGAEQTGQGKPGLYENPRQQTLDEVFCEENGYGAGFIEQARHGNVRIIGQLFDTYWLTQAQDKLFVIDQHAAHEKVLYERMMKRFASRELTSQQLSPPMVLSLNIQEQTVLEEHMELLTGLGFSIETFGGREYVISAVPDNLYDLDGEAYFYELLDAIAASPSGKATPETLFAKIATAACKAAIKGNQQISRPEAEELIKELLTLENPYHCPHGRPTMISMSRREIEKKFKRVL